MGVSERFSRFLDNIALTVDQKEAGKARKESVIEKMNAGYYSQISKTAHAQFVGSWGKYTRIRPPRDVDVLFEMPSSVYHRFQERTGNRQSQLLAEVRVWLKKSYPNTDVRGSGPIVLVPFSTYNVELIPAFRLDGGRYYVCMTDDGGRYKIADYDAEITAISTSNKTHNDKTRDLVRMMKCWQAYCSVSIKSFWIELLAIDFLNQWEHAGKTRIYYDYMIRDFLKYMIARQNTYVYAPGTYEGMDLGTLWVSRAETAYARAVKACDYEPTNPVLAGDEWGKIFGTDIPR